MCEEEIKSIIADYRMDCGLPERLLTPGDRSRFERACFIRWALDELEAYILCNPDVDPIESVSCFVNKATDYMHRYPRTRVMFFIATDVARDIHDILICAS